MEGALSVLGERGLLLRGQGKSHRAHLRWQKLIQQGTLYCCCRISLQNTESKSACIIGISGGNPCVCEVSPLCILSQVSMTFVFNVVFGGLLMTSKAGANHWLMQVGSGGAGSAISC